MASADTTGPGPATGPATGQSGSQSGGEPERGGQGPLAQLIASRGGQAAPEAPFVIEHREALIYMLCQAAELEHGIMCQYLFAVFSLKQSTGEGLTDAELAAVQRWRRVISHVAAQEMLHLALVQNLLSAIGAAPHLSRPNLPLPAAHYPAGVQLVLLPFGEEALRHFMFLERPEGYALDDADGLAAHGQAVPAMSQGEIVPRAQDFATVGHLYRSIEQGIAHLADKYGERALFAGPPRAQATASDFRWPDLVAVTDVASAQRAIDTILEQGEGPRGAWRDAHFGQFVGILEEYQQLRAANPDFEPARPAIAANVRQPERATAVPLIADPGTARVSDLFNVAYEILLQLLERYFAHTEETDEQLTTLADAAVGLMLRALVPLGNLLTTLPAGPGYEGSTVGPSFELFYETDYLIPHREAAWALISERLGEAVSFCDFIRTVHSPGTQAALEPVFQALTDIGQSLDLHVGAGEPAAPGPADSPSPPAPAELDALRRRAEDLAGQVGQARAPGQPDASQPASPQLADLFGAVFSLVTPGPNRSESSLPIVTTQLPRLVDSVLRPLAGLLTRPPAGHAPSATDAPPATDSPPPTPVDLSTEPGSPASPDTDPLWAAAVAATRLRVRLAGDAPAELLEATAALQNLALTGDPAQVTARRAELWRLSEALPAGVRVAQDGPYLVTGVRRVLTHLGEPRPVPPQFALCRCGQSAIKPLCDGSHVTAGFTGAKDPHRVPDRRDSYPGPQATILDNRGICQHSGLCTDRLPVAFRSGQEPFVAPAGGRLDEIVVAVRDCPSGALSLAIDGREAREVADWAGTREPAIVVTRDGPYRLTGGIAVTGADGAPEARAQGASAEHCALCRCGQSQNKPFCSGMHWYVGFHDPVPAPGAEPTLFEWAGGLPALTRMTRRLYQQLVPGDALLAPLFATMPAGYPEHEAARLATAFGGPAEPAAPAGPAAPDGGPAGNGSGSDGGGQAAAWRAGLTFTGDQRARWVLLAGQAGQDTALPADAGFRAALVSYLEWDSRQGPADGTSGTGQPGPTWGWTAAGPPRTDADQADSTPDAAAPLPGPDEPVSFATHIKPLFRASDRKSMSFAFDLWSLDDVRAHGRGVLARLADGSMPCDGAWPAERVAVFRRWVESGQQA